jgi:hypothetical protein
MKGQVQHHTLDDIESKRVYLFGYLETLNATQNPQYRLVWIASGQNAEV